MEKELSETHSSDVTNPTRAKKKSLPQKSVELATAKLINQLKTEINKGLTVKKVQDSDIIRAGVEKLGPQDIMRLRDNLLTPADRLKVLYEDNRKLDKKLTYDVFITQIMESHLACLAMKTAQSNEGSKPAD